MNEFIDHLKDVFRLFGPFAAKRMFSGHGLFRDGLMFGLVVRDTLYLKADAQSVPQFEKLGLPPFEYQRAGKLARLSYYTAPEAVTEDAAEAAKWARMAFEAALRAHAAKAAKAGKIRKNP
jgi:DNA transformation protein